MNSLKMFYGGVYMYDITIVGTGVSGVFLAYTLIAKENGLKILMIEKGRKFIERICPIENGDSEGCVHCTICNKTQGFGGMGRSEGKYNYTNDFGGQIGEKIGEKSAMNLMEDVDEILCSFGADKVTLYSTENEELKKRVKGNNYTMLTTKVRHLGTTLSREILNKMYLSLKDKVQFKFETDIISINKVNDVFKLSDIENVYYSKKVVLATGISGGEQFLEFCKCFNIKPNSERVDLGVRVEMKGDQLDSILKDSFETKIRYKSNEFEAITYCMNPKGKVIKKYQEGLVMADGQNYIETDKPSCNLNFSVLIPKYFDCYNEAKEYARVIIESINKGKGWIVIQRYEDLVQGRATTKHNLNKNTIRPSMQGEVGNLYNEIPEIYIDGLLKIFESIECIIGKKISRDTLLYGIDAKFYEPRINTDEYFETKQKGLYVIGDCSGTTFSLSQAAVSGVYLGRHILSVH